MSGAFEGPRSESRDREQKIERRDWGIALDVPEECRQEAFRIRDEILARGIVLANKLEDFPHITLFQGEFLEGSAGGIKGVVEETITDFLSGENRSLEISMQSQLHFRRGNNNIFWNVEISDQLAILHKMLDERLRSLPEWGIMKQFRDRLEQGELTAEEQEHVRRYGVLSAGKFFLPHITIGKLADVQDAAAIETFSVNPITFKADAVLVGQVNRVGQITSVISREKL